MLDGVNDEEQHAHQLGKLLGMLQVVSFYVLNVEMVESSNGCELM